MTRFEKAVEMIKEMFPDLPSNSVEILAKIIDLQLNKLNK